MFPRIITSRRKNKTYQYLAISESIRKKGKSTTRNLAILGNIEKFRKFDIENLIDGLIKIFKLEKYVLSGEVEILESLEYGSIIFWQKLWNDLNLTHLISEQLRHRTHPIDIAAEKYIEMMVINRCIEPSSKLGILRWLETTCYKEMKNYADLPLDVHYFYRSMDYLLEMKDTLERAIYEQLRNLFSINVNLTFYDITSNFFYGENCPISDHGYSRDHRRDCEQIVVGVVTSYEGYPLKHYVFQGNTTDVTTVPEVVRQLKKDYQINETIFVGDRGMVSKLNLKEIEQNGFDHIMGVKVHQNELCQMLFTRNEINWTESSEYKNLKLLDKKVMVKDFLIWKSKDILANHDIVITDDAFLPFVELIESLTNESEPKPKDFRLLLQAAFPELDPKICQKIWNVIKRYKEQYEKEFRFVICLNPDRKISSEKKREKHLSELSKELDELFSENKKDVSETEKSINKIFSGWKSKFRKLFEIERSPETKKAVGYQKNDQKIESEKELDGVFVLSSSKDDDPENGLKMEKVVESYKNLKEVETLFDDFKNFVDIRPIRHWTEIRVRAHVFVCILSLLLKRIFEIDKLCNKSVTEPLAEIDKAKLVKYKIKFSEREDRTQTIPKVTNISPTQKKYFNMIGIKNPINLEKFLW